MGKYLDSSGVTYLWGKIKGLFTDSSLNTGAKTITGAINEINTKVSNMTGAFVWKGKFDTLPAVASYEAGNVIGVGNKEYVLTVTGDTKAWVEFGDEGSYLLKSTAESTYLKKNDASTTYAPKSHTHTKSQITDFPTIPTVNDAKVTIKMNGSEKGNFTLNQSSTKEIDLGTVITQHQDISGKLDKAKLTPILKEIDLTGTDAQRKAKLDQFEADWNTLVGTAYSGARFIGKVQADANTDREISVLFEYDYYSGANYYGIGAASNGKSYKVELHRNNGSFIITPLFQHLEAVTIKTSNSDADKAANVAAIKAYVDNLKSLGVDVTKGVDIPLVTKNIEDAGVLYYKSSETTTYGIFNSGYYMMVCSIAPDGYWEQTYELQGATSSALTTTSKQIVGAINEVNAAIDAKLDKAAFLTDTEVNDIWDNN